MSTIEQELLDEASLDKAPTCQIFHKVYAAGSRTGGARFLCGKPSVIRLRFSCKCGRVKTCFVCRSDWQLIKRGSASVVCDTCGEPDFQWTES